MARLVDTFYGFGAEACSGISSPTIYRVTTTSDTGTAGSLRYALQQSGHRIVVFTTGGTFETTTPIRIDSPYCIILGHTAPSDSGGVTLKPASGCRNAPLLIRASNIVIRHVRFRSWDSYTGVSDIDCVTAYKTGAGPTITDVMFDHCSFSWAPDENVNIGNAQNVTLQWCIISESIADPHKVYLNNGKGSQVGMYQAGEKAGKITYFGCLFAHNGIRNPEYAGGYGPCDVINCVAYDGVDSFTKVRTQYIPLCGGQAQANIVGNYYKKGPTTPSSKSPIIADAGGGPIQLYLSGNVHDWGSSLTSGSYTSMGSMIGPRPTHETPTAMTAAQAFTTVLANAGCRVPHFDSVDARVVEQVRNGTGSHLKIPQEVGGWPTLAAGTAWTDSDSDGLPNSYETDAGGDTTSTSPTGTNGSGMLHVLAWGEELLAEGGWAGDPDPGDVSPGDLPDEFDIYTIANGDDNGYYDSAYANLGSLYAGDSSATIYDARACVRFTDISIPQGYTVSEAYIEMHVATLAGSGWSVNIVGEDADTSLPFTGLDTDFEDRFETNATTATVADTIAADEAGTWWRSPDIASIINEITARGSWAAGNALSLCVEDGGTGYDSLRVIEFSAYDDGSAPRLLLNLAAAGGGGGESGSQDLQVAAATHDKWRREVGTALQTGNFGYAGDNHSSNYDNEMVIAFQLSEDIPATANIDAATLSLFIYAADGANFDLDIAAEDDAAPTIPVVDDTDLDGRSFVTASNWTAASVSTGTWLDIDVSTTIQALITSQGALSSGDYINLFVQDGGVGWNSVQRRLTIYNYDYTTYVARAPKLGIEWTVPSATDRAIAGGIRGGIAGGLNL